VIESIILGLTIIFLLIAHAIKSRFDKQHKANISDFSQYDDYRRLQSA
jgi:hypothetical protein